MLLDAPVDSGAACPCDPSDRSAVGAKLRSLVTLAMVVTVSLGALDAAARAAVGPSEPAGVRAWPGVLLRVVGTLIHADESETVVGSEGLGLRDAQSLRPVRRAMARSAWSGLVRLGLIDLPPPVSV